MLVVIFWKIIIFGSRAQYKPENSQNLPKNITVNISEKQ